MLPRPGEASHADKLKLDEKEGEGMKEWGDKERQKKRKRSKGGKLRKWRRERER